MKSRMKCFAVVALCLCFALPSFSWADHLHQCGGLRLPGECSAWHGLQHGIERVDDAVEIVVTTCYIVASQVEYYGDAVVVVVFSESDTTPSPSTSTTTDYYDPHMGFDPNKGTSEERAPTYQENPAEEKCYPLTSADPSDYCGDTDDDDD